MSKPVYHYLPNFITLMSLVTGCVAIIMAFQPELRSIAPWLIVLSAFLDFFDGFTARMLKAYSELGKQLDSLADVVSFGVAPGIIAFQIIWANLLESDPALTMSNLSAGNIALLLPALIFPAFSALRLGIFNIDTSQKLSFRGLPTPGSALFIVFLSLSLFHGRSVFLSNLLYSDWFFPVVLLLLSYLMVSPLRMLSLKFSNWNVKKNILKYILILSGILLIPLLGITGALLTLVVYLILSVIFHFTDGSGIKE